MISHIRERSFITSFAELGAGPPGPERKSSCPARPGGFETGPARPEDFEVGPARPGDFETGLARKGLARAARNFLSLAASEFIQFDF